MSTNDDALIEKITSREADLVAIYNKMYSLLTNPDRLTNVNGKGLDGHQLAALRTLKPSTEIEPSEAVGVLRSIIGSTDDKLKLELLHPVRLPDGRLLGHFLRDKLNKIGIVWEDLFPYLSVRGWFVNNTKKE
jgi:hypothetical protein